MGRYLLGIDVSTTGAKALLIDERGAVVASATTALSLSNPKPLWSEQDPHEWWTGTIASIRRAMSETRATGEDVGAIGLTGQMHGLVLLDASHNVLRPAILWNDRRTGAECEEIHRRVGREALIREAGNVALTGFTAPKILWVRNNEPEIYAKAKLVLLPKRTTCACGSPAKRRWTRPAARGRSSSSCRRVAGRRRSSTRSRSRPRGCPPRSRARRRPGV